MSAHPADTTPEAWTVQTTVWRRMGPVRRLKTALKLSEDIRAVSAAGIRRRHPDYTPAQVRWALLRQQFGDELFGRVYPEAPLLEP